MFLHEQARHFVDRIAHRGPKRFAHEDTLQDTSGRSLDLGILEPERLEVAPDAVPGAAPIEQGALQ